jgi:hypothetical protein
MPSTIVHLAFAGLLAAALLGEAYGRTSVVIVLVVVAFPDLDSFLALVYPPAHRTVLHTLVIPILGGLFLWVDLRYREESFIRQCWGGWGLRVAWVSAVAYAVSAIGLDMVDGVVNLLWPLHDQFYTLRGSLELSNQRGIVQTFVEFGDSSVPQPTSAGTTETLQPTTGVEPSPGEEPETEPERIFPVFRAGWQLLLFLVGTAVTIARFKLPQELPGEE